MNKFEAKVIDIDSLENLTIVQFNFKNITLSMMSLGLSNIDIGTKVILSVNASHIAIAKSFTGDISLSNRLDCVIKKLDKGKLLSSLSLDFQGTVLTSIITTNSVNRMNLKENDEIIAFIKASELSIQKVIS
ncbi:TOBE domain-containing protein [Poseidonibacter ostreae]|jgi:molybdopterin-binding protein|uniref:Transporter n=1 Tax=Poseidonibacter ostreae TaxID=2654171 RepID=A0A6L4WSZ9_9BACT|nr:TOBE domain-containing protein [Poseidonibacter ostreae]KAB7887073.1 transporter [Poseidonibacter ostreae]KAB7889203.1 transporter [Poseidonibacter ostreae]KAB7891596.1 transporter [Poseidonibacter ostreae]MAC84805.1 transporter [Arcobacter sp.]|tara:strand:+ start:1420 stop:1815 length:396 start_codon:yes stop_codon:yes gene_type:complete